MIGDNHFKCGGDNTTVARLHLFSRFSHGLVNIKNIMLAPFNHILLDLIVLLATNESLCTTGPPFRHDRRNSSLEGLTIDLTKPFISQWIRPLRGPVLVNTIL